MACGQLLRQVEEEGARLTAVEAQRVADAPFVAAVDDCLKEVHSGPESGFRSAPFPTSSPLGCRRRKRWRKLNQRWREVRWRAMTGTLARPRNVKQRWRV